MNKFFATTSTNFADQQASYTSDFQQRLNALNEQSLRAYREEQAAKIQVIVQLDADIDMIFA